MLSPPTPRAPPLHCMLCCGCITHNKPLTFRQGSTWFKFSLNISFWWKEPPLFSTNNMKNYLPTTFTAVHLSPWVHLNLFQWILFVASVLVHWNAEVMLMIILGLSFPPLLIRTERELHVFSVHYFRMWLPV